ncbi:hypothetical protein CUJ83_06035 [Methanocella sp. CWC-04]|uniref:Sugar-specific transcriptional regulator TrmB n=1 Tax=Methanooceanicella nereidis TaxID=2052831 RepID=A0AAP2RDA8_9EURY|nr:helix-turn-helix domain-containing protein [Methanocella sp. CWC-04]MCD1294560.1 hypothetical protein [Methanocella sp. CWC-04]
MSDEWVVDSFKRLGLTEYEARAYMALNRIKAGTVSDIHVASGIPRSAIYGALTKLEEKGLIEVEHGKPMRYRSIIPSKAMNKIKSAIDDERDKVLNYLEEAHARGENDEASEAVWTIRGVKNLYNKLSDTLCDAEKDIILIATDPIFVELEKHYSIFGNIRPIINRRIEEGVRVRVVCTQGSDVDLIRSEIPKVEIRVIDPSKPSSKLDFRGGVLMVDNAEVMISILDKMVQGEGKDITAVYTRMDSMISVFKHFAEVEWDSALPV